MSLAIWEAILSFAERAGDFFCDISALILLFCPFAVFVVWLILCFAVRGLRGRSKNAYLFVSDICLFLFAALALCAHQAPLLVLAVALVFRAAYYPFFGILCLFGPVSAKEKGKLKKSPKKQAFSAEKRAEVAEPVPVPERTVQAEQRPRMVRCYDRTRGVVVEQDVRLGHIFSVLERLKNLPLGAGDRLEAQKYEDLLSVYRNKGNLSSAEAQTLNDILASLLKMMAKYDI